MNRYQSRCIHFSKQGGNNCPYLNDPDDRCNYNNECIRDKVKDNVDNRSTKKIVKKYKY